MEILKVSASKWIKTHGSGFDEFHWQRGYGAFSVSESGKDAVVKYIENQEEHHRKQGFQEEYRLLLARHQVTYDERYVCE